MKNRKAKERSSSIVAEKKREGSLWNHCEGIFGGGHGLIQEIYEDGCRDVPESGGHNVAVRGKTGKHRETCFPCITETRDVSFVLQKHMLLLGSKRCINNIFNYLRVCKMHS